MTALAADGHLGDSVGEVRRSVVAKVAFDDRDLAVLLRDDKVARMSDARFAAGRDEQQMDRLLDDDATGHEDEGAVAEEGGVESSEGGFVEASEAAEVSLDQVWPLGQSAGQRQHEDARRQCAGERDRTTAIDDDDALARALDVAAAEDAADVLGTRPMERNARQRRDVGEAPVLVVGRRKAKFGEALDGRVPQTVKHAVGADFLLERGEVREVVFLFFHHCRHVRSLLPFSRDCAAERGILVAIRCASRLNIAQLNTVCAARGCVPPSSQP